MKKLQFGLNRIRREALFFRNFYWSNLFAFIFLAFSSLVSCSNEETLPDVEYTKESTTIETAEGIEMIYTDSAITALRISSPKMIRKLSGADPVQEFTDGLRVEFYDKEGNITATLSAKYALRKEDSSTFTVRDSVIWRSNKGEQLETEELIWEKDLDKVHTSKFVLLKRPEEILYGYGFESNQQFTQWKIIAIEGRLRGNEISQELTK